jgi:hypothetical protein
MRNGNRIILIRRKSDNGAADVRGVERKKSKNPQRSGANTSVAHYTLGDAPHKSKQTSHKNRAKMQASRQASKNEGGMIRETGRG